MQATLSDLLYSLSEKDEEINNDFLEFLNEYGEECINLSKIDVVLLRKDILVIKTKNLEKIENDLKQKGKMYKLNLDENKTEFFKYKVFIDGYDKYMSNVINQYMSSVMQNAIFITNLEGKKAGYLANIKSNTNKIKKYLYSKGISLSDIDVDSYINSLGGDINKLLEDYNNKILNKIYSSNIDQEHINDLKNEIATCKMEIDTIEKKIIKSENFVRNLTFYIKGKITLTENSMIIYKVQNSFFGKIKMKILTEFSSEQKRYENFISDILDNYTKKLVELTQRKLSYEEAE